MSVVSRKGKKEMLKLDTKGQFRILIISDIQKCRPLNQNEQQHIEALIANSNPYLIVLLGDMILGHAIISKGQVRRIIQSIIDPIEKNKTNFVFVTGNHDLVPWVSLEKQVDIYRDSPYCLTPSLSDRDCPEAYYLDIMDESRAIVSRLLFLDSGSSRLSFKGIDYSPASKEQLRFSRLLLSPSSCPPVFIFQHIPVPEIYDLLKEVSSDVHNSVSGRGSYRGKRFCLSNEGVGILGEAPCSPWENVGQFVDWVKSGKVQAAVFGHDHKNSFTGSVEGITLIQNSCAGLSCYGRDDLRGGYLLTINSNAQFEAEALYYKDLII